MNDATRLAPESLLTLDPMIRHQLHAARALWPRVQALHLGGPTQALYVLPKVEILCWHIEQAHLRKGAFAL